MSARDDPILAATKRASRQLAEAIDELRQARINARLSQKSVAVRVGISRSRLGRVERGDDQHVHVELLGRISGAVGLELSLRTFAGAGAGVGVLRDGPQVRVLDRFRERLGAPWEWLAEVPLPIPGDQRAWDLVGTHLETGLMIWVEAESRLRDSQALLRRVALKRRDAGATRVVLVLNDTHGNRLAVRDAASSLHEAFPGEMRRAIVDLIAGRDPGDDVMVFL